MKISNGTNDKELINGMKKTLQGLILETHKKQETINTLSPTPGNTSLATASANQQTVSSSDSPWSPIVNSVGSEEQAAIQPLDYSERLADAVRNREELHMPELAETQGHASMDSGGIPTVSSSAPEQRRQEEEDNMWIKVGGGIAVLGAAVVGGAFVAMNQNNPNASAGQQQGRRNNQSTVTVEEVDENAEGQNSWESMGRDATRRAQ